MDFNSLVNGLMSNEKGGNCKPPFGGFGFGSSCIWIILFLIFCGFGNDFGGSDCGCDCGCGSRRGRCHRRRGRCRRRRHHRDDCGCCDDNFIFIIVILAILLCSCKDNRHHNGGCCNSLMDTNSDQLRTVEEN